MNKLIQVIESFIPAVLQEKPETLTRARFLVVYLFILAGLGAVYNLIYFKVGNYYGGAAIVMMVAIIFSLPFYLRRTANLAKTMHMCSLGMTLMNGTIMFTSGGAGFSGNPWWTIAPVFTTLVVGGKAGRYWLIGVTSLLGGAYVAEQLGVTFPNMIQYTPENKDWIHFLDWFHYFGIILVLTAAALVFDYINRQALASELANRSKVEEANRETQLHNQYLDESVARILREMEKLANGDLTTRLPMLNDDAIGHLCQGYNQAVAHVAEAIEEVNQSAEITANSSQDIGNATSILSSHAKQQTDKAGQITESTFQIVSLIAENAANADRTAEAAQENGGLATDGGSVVRMTMSKMEEIAEKVSLTAKSIMALGRSTSEIGNIVGVIRGIAERTNLLALNAAIEACHAGESGKGFAVIAGEVKELAGQTTVETERIATMIENVQAEARQAVSEMEAGNAQVSEGKQLASQAGDALERIVESSDNVSHLIQQIATACKEQTRQSEFLFQQIEDLKGVTDDTAEEIGGIAGSATKLGGMTRDLQKLLTRFQLTNAA